MISSSLALLPPKHLNVAAEQRKRTPTIFLFAKHQQFPTAICMRAFCLKGKAFERNIKVCKHKINEHEGLQRTICKAPHQDNGMASAGEVFFYH
jgi:hypothetical protein